MRLVHVLCAAASAAVLAASAPASAATLIHAYDFANSGGAAVVDTVGGANGVPVGDAHIAGGVLALDGQGDEVDFGAYLVPQGLNPFSVFIRTEIDPVQNYLFEIISQGSSGLPGFYIGSNGGNGFRLTDAYFAPGVALPSRGVFHDLLLTNGASGLRFSIDGTEVFAAGQVNFGAGGAFTRLGQQFTSTEYFHGQIDTVKIFDGVATYAEATRGGAVPEPQAWTMMIAGFFGMGALLRRRGSGGRMALPA